MKPLAECQLYTFVDTAYLQGRAPELVAQQLCDGGSDLIQLRAKNSSTDEIRAMAEKILPVTKRAKVGFVVNDHLKIAREIGADFCHLGQEDFVEFRIQNSEFRSWNSEIKIGLSTHAPEQAKDAMKIGIDYLGVGPIFATDTKPSAKPVTLEYVRWANENVNLPWFAIGGVNLETVDEILAAGAKRICVVSAILNSPDIAKTCAEFRRKLA